MKETSVKKLARKLMDKEGLINWKFKFKNLKQSRIAETKINILYSDKNNISFSKYFLFRMKKLEIKNALLHEIAHAITWEDHEGDNFRAKCDEFGCSSEPIMVLQNNGQYN